MSHLVNVNGVIAPADKAVIAVMDHGFLYGDGVYETIRTYEGEPFLLDKHLDRLETSCRMIRLRPPDRARIAAEVRRTVAEAANEESYIRIMVTRGVGPIGYEAALAPSAGLVVIVAPYKPIPERLYAEGVSAVIGRRRRNPVESLDPAIKSCNLLNNVLGHMEAEDAGAHEALLLNTKGNLAEGTHTNVFFIEKGTLRTPSLTCGILSGITRDVILLASREAGIPVEEGDYPRERILAADEIFISSTLQEVLPVTRLDGKPVGDGRPGPLTRRIHDLFRLKIEALRHRR